MLKAYETSGNVLFEEKQHFPSWIKILTIGIVVFTIVVILIAGITGPAGEREDMWFALAIVIPVDILLLVVFQNVVFEKLVTTNGVYYRWRPWQKRYRMIEKEDLESFTIRRFPFLSYGFGWFPTYGWYHHAAGGEGVQLYLKRGGKYFFGTGNKEQLEIALRNLTSSNPKSNLREF